VIFAAGIGALALLRGARRRGVSKQGE
jgi:hypothetical protein